MIDLLKPAIGVASLSSPLEVGAEKAPKTVVSLVKVLNQNGFQVESFGSIETADQARETGKQAAAKQIDAMVFAPVCWYEDYYVLDFMEECSVPFLIWPLPGMETGALCGAQQQTFFLNKLGHPYEAVFGGFDDPVCLRKAKVFIRAASLRNRMRRARIGFSGQRVLGMTDTACDEHMLKKAVGPRIVPLYLPAILSRTEELLRDESSGKLWKDKLGGVSKSVARDEDGIRAMAAYQAIKEKVDEYGLQALTVGCYPDLMGIVCLAASLLADQGVPMSCEGDINGAAAMYLLMLLTGSPVHSTDWLDPLKDGSVVLTHCGSGSFDLAEVKDNISLAPVRLMERGVCALFPAKPGPVTLISLDPKPGGYRCAVLEGEAVKTEMVFPGNPVRVVFKQDTKDILDWIFREGIGHHWMVGYGHMAAELRMWGRIVGEVLTIQEEL